MPSVAFSGTFARYVWYRSGTAIAWGTIVLSLGLAVLTIFPHIPIAARVPISFLGLLGLLALSDVLTLADKVETGQSAYPRQLFLLPASSSALAIVPLCGGAALMTLLGLALGYGVCGPFTGYGQAWWAAPFLVATVCLSSAMAWSSYPHATIRLLVALVGVALLLAGPVTLVAGFAEPWQVGLAYLASIPFSVAWAIRSVGLARCGDAARSWKLAGRVKARPAFRSPMEAQVWLEVKRNGMFAPVMLCFLIATLVAVAPFVIASSDQTLRINGTLICQPAVGFSASIVGLSVVLLGLSGCCASPLDNLTTAQELQPFLALRPMSTAELVEAKMRMAVVVLIRCSAISLVTAIGLLLIPAAANPGGRPTLFVLAQTLTWQQVALGCVLYFAALVGAWKGMVSGIWCGLGRLRPFARAVVCGVLPMVLMVAMLGIPMFLFSNPGYLPTVLAAVPYVAGTIMGLKLGLAGFAARRLREMALVSDGMIVRWVGVWVAVAVVLICAEAPSRSLLGLSLTGLAFSQFLSLPFGRVALTPILVSANRHR